MLDLTKREASIIGASLLLLLLAGMLILRASNKDFTINLNCEKQLEKISRQEVVAHEQ